VCAWTGGRDMEPEYLLWTDRLLHQVHCFFSQPAKEPYDSISNLLMYKPLKNEINKKSQSILILDPDCISEYHVALRSSRPKTQEGEWVCNSSDGFPRKTKGPIIS
jgi:hypothetical protein